MSCEIYSEHWVLTKLCLRPDLTTPYAKPNLWTPVPYARCFLCLISLHLGRLIANLCSY